MSSAEGFLTDNLPDSDNTYIIYLKYIKQKNGNATKPNMNDCSRLVTPQPINTVTTDRKNDQSVVTEGSFYLRLSFTF